MNRRSVVLVVVAVPVVAVVAGAVGVSLADRSGPVAPPAGTTSADGRASTQARWVVSDLGTLGGEESSASAVNERGQVIGRSGVHASFVWEKGKMRDLGSLGATSWRRLCEAVAINDRGEIIGLSKTKGGAYHPFLWHDRRMIDLAVHGLLVAGSYEALNEREGVFDINNRGRIVGRSLATVLSPRSFVWFEGTATYLDGPSSPPVAINERGQIVGGGTLWERGTRHDLGSLGSDPPATHALAINERGQVVGWSDTAAIDAYGAAAGHAFLWENGKMRDLGTLGGPTSWASDINERGQVVGQGDTTAVVSRHMPIVHAFLWENGKMRDLGTPRGSVVSSAVAINQPGQVVGNGYALTSDGLQRVESRAFVWQDGRMTELSTLGGDESEAHAINNRGQIVGWAATGTGQKHAVLWTLRNG